MKKFFAVLMAAVLLILPVSLSACSSATSETGYGDWIEVQSITYHVGDETTTLTSTYEIGLSDTRQSSRKEFDATPDEQKLTIDTFGVSDEIEIDKSNIIDNPSQLIGNEYYIKVEDHSQYIIAKVESYEICYVKYRTLSDGMIEVTHNKWGIGYITQKILPVSYEVTEFIN